MNATITVNAGGYEVTVEFDNGFSESIEGLYDLDSAFDYIRMHHAYQNNRYVRR